MYVSKIGPLDGDRGGSFLYAVFHKHSPAKILDGSNDDSLLRSVQEGYPGEKLTCSTDLVSAGRPLGFECVDPDEDVARQLAVISSGVALNTCLYQGTNPIMLMGFLETASHFWNSRVRHDWNPSFVLGLSVTGRYEAYEVKELFFCVIIPEPAPRILMFLDSDDVQRLFDLVAIDSAEANEVDRSAVFFRRGPDYAVKANARAWNAEMLPEPSSVTAGERWPWHERRLLVFSAVAWALAALNPNEPTAEYSRTFDDALGNSITVAVSPGGTLKIPESVNHG